jgi:branched-chain amino acid transport system ATP-binding protein
MPDSAAPRFVCRDLKAARQTVPVVDGITLEIAAGTAVGVVGQAGSGKTSLLMALVGLVDRVSGQVMVDGTDLSGLTPAARVRHGLRLASPSLSLIPALTVAEHFELASGNAAPPPVFARLLADARATPARVLSGGMQRVLAIAAALAAGPKVLLVDDLGEGLQPGVLDVVVEWLWRAKDERTAMILVDRSLAVLERLCERVILMEGGRAISTSSVPINDETKRELRRRLL